MVYSTRPPENAHLIRLIGWKISYPMSESAFTELCNNPDNSRLLGINSHADERWFLQEGMTALAGVVALQAEIMPLTKDSKAEKSSASANTSSDILRQRLARAAAVGYRLDKFLSLG